MRFAFIDSYPDSKGGAPRSMLTLCQALSNMEHKIFYITTDNGGVVEKAKKYGISTLITSKNKKLPDRHSKFSFSCFFNLIVHNLKSLLLIRNKFDFICVNEPRVFVYYFLLLLFTRSKIVYYVRINENLGVFHRFAAWLCYRVIKISSDSSSAFDLKTINRHRDKFRLVKTGFNFKSNPSFKFINDGVLKICFVGSYCSRKNQEFIIRSCQLLNIPVEVSFYGPLIEVDYYEHLLDISRETNSFIKFYFHEHVEDVVGTMSCFDIFFMASLREGLPRVVIEALFSGLYIVSTRTDGIYDIITDDYLGVVIDSDNPELFARHIEGLKNSLFTDDVRTLRKLYVEKVFSVEHYSKSFLEAIES